MASVRVPVPWEELDDSDDGAMHMVLVGEAELAQEVFRAKRGLDVVRERVTEQKIVCDALYDLHNKQTKAGDTAAWAAAAGEKDERKATKRKAEADAALEAAHAKVQALHHNVDQVQRSLGFGRGSRPGPVRSHTGRCRAVGGRYKHKFRHGE